jgi:hypothetical protein
LSQQDNINVQKQFGDAVNNGSAGGPSFRGRWPQNEKMGAPLFA